jgi:hypothetical protein
VSADALVHQYWMSHWKDAALFNDPLTAELRHSARYPDGYQALFWVASRVADPIWFGEVVGVALMALSGFLVFLVVREHTAWRPAAWIGAALFLVPFEIHRFYGGFPRAFAVSQAVLFRLYLPHRYTYPLLAFCAIAIAIAVTLRPTWVALTARRPRLGAFALLAAPAALCAFAIFAFPLAPPEPRATVLAVALVAIPAVLALWLRNPRLGAVVTGATLIVAVLVLPGGLVREGTPCPQRPVTRYLSTLPKHAVIAGDPAELMCIPATTHTAS